jgi:hypothetical protein
MCFYRIVNLSVNTFEYICRSVPLDELVTQLILDKVRNSAHSLICNITCCLLSLFLLCILFVCKYFRQPKNKCKSTAAVKMNCLVFIFSWISSTTVNKKNSYSNFLGFFCFLFGWFFLLLWFFSLLILAYHACVIKIINREITSSKYNKRFVNGLFSNFLYSFACKIVLDLKLS